jgi:hypothetical protein
MWRSFPKFPNFRWGVGVVLNSSNSSSSSNDDNDNNNNNNNNFVTITRSEVFQLVNSIYE